MIGSIIAARASQKRAEPIIAANQSLLRTNHCCVSQTKEPNQSLLQEPIKREPNQARAIEDRLGSFLDGRAPVL